MATVTHIIRSRYDPKTREKLERETGQLDEEDPWVTESAQFGRRRLLNAPRFVAASGSSTPLNDSDNGGASSRDISNWYADLTRSQSQSPAVNMAISPKVPNQPSVSMPCTKNAQPNHHDWFITKALSSQEPRQPPPTPTLADYLARDPPPLPHEQSLKPPVWLALGPTNKGYGMLERIGWSEGEALGLTRSRWDEGSPSQVEEPPEEKLRRLEEWVDEDICEVRHAEVVDLTGSDDEFLANFAPNSTKPIISTKSIAQPDDGFTALLTPIATTLKSDRLGIGLKAKTVGPYRASKKRITHNAAALAKHIREAEEAKRKRMQDGRGRRGHERRSQREETHRKELLAYMNS